MSTSTAVVLLMLLVIVVAPLAIGAVAFVMAEAGDETGEDEDRSA